MTTLEARQFKNFLHFMHTTCAGGTCKHCEFVYRNTNDYRNHMLAEHQDHEAEFKAYTGVVR